jgi:hypothetical protein
MKHLPLTSQFCDIPSEEAQLCETQDDYSSAADASDLRELRQCDCASGSQHSQDTTLL